LKSKNEHYEIRCLSEESNGMKKRNAVMSTILGASFLFSGVMLAQDPVQDIDKKIHPNLAAAQNNVVQANNYIITAQKDNRYDMQGHAEKARQLLVQVNQELKLAAEAANASMGKKK
jgi:hypothetical protein